MKFKVAVVGGGPSGACAAEALAKTNDVEVVLFERKMDNAKPCGGAIPLCMIDEFDLPVSIIDRKVRRRREYHYFLRFRPSVMTHQVADHQKKLKPRDTTSNIRLVRCWSVH